MCGIVGFLRASAASAEADRELLRTMAACVKHRGPDDEGVFVEGPCGLGQRRLAVIDISPAGHQPMTRGRATVTLNGEIYNYRELRAELEALGETFVTHSDTEVLLAAVERWGLKALDKLNGMFAFALWHSGSRELLIVRDRIGKKPLYWSKVGRDLVFASEIKGLLPYPGLGRRPNHQAIHHYLSMQYVPSPLTAFKGVWSLPPGHLMVVKAGAEPKPQRWWSLPEPGGAASAKSDDDLAGEARELLSAAVKRRLVADVPVGAFLSGGLDSSAVTALMAQHAGKQIKTFSIGFKEEKYDERRFARMVAERYKTDHHEEVVEEDAASIIPDLVWHYGQPFADPSAIPTFYLSRLARRHVTVALSGDGGDELFLGYDRYAVAKSREWVDGIPGVARAALGAGSAAIAGPLANVKGFRGLKHYMRLWSSSRASRYEPTIMYFLEADKAEGYGPALRGELGSSTLNLLAPYLEAAGGLMEGAAWADLHSYLPDDILVKVDVASMAFGLEARAPFLDVELMEWAARLPAAKKVGEGGELKALLKRAVKDLLPQEIINRPKMGFGAPLDVWLRGGFAGMARDVLTSDKARARGLFKPEYVDRLLSEHMLGKRMHHQRLWAMLMLELWFAMWIDGSSLEKPGAQHKSAA